MRIDERRAAELLRTWDNILILTHRKPDGDAIGSSLALCYALRSLGKTVGVACADPMIVGRYREIFRDEPERDFAPAYLVAVDTASIELLAGAHEPYGGAVSLCIDHHGSHAEFAADTLLDPVAAACAELVFRVIAELGAQPDRDTANAVFTGLTTDTGGFRFPNTTSRTHRTAAEMLDWGADSARINQLMFMTRSRGRIAVEKLMLDTMAFCADGRCAMNILPADLNERFGVTEEELEGISGFSNTIEGILAGVTVREKKDDDSLRISVRTKDPLDAAAICRALGGGGHRNAAGCTLYGDAQAAARRVLAEVEREIQDKL